MGVTWKVVDGRGTDKVPLAAKDCQDPDLKEGNMDIAGCVSGRTSDLQAIS